MIRSLLPFLLAAVPCAAQKSLTANTLDFEEGAGPPPAAIADVAWLVGRWVGEGFGGTVEENWGPARGGAMVATFRLVRDDGPQFYEICLLAEVDGSLAYKVKHFHPDLKGWEEKDDYVTFPLVKLEPNTAYFRGLTVKREGDRCTHYLAMKGRDGSYREAVLRFERADTAPAAAEGARDVTLAGLEPLLGTWTPKEAPDRIVHDYAFTVGQHAMRLREGYPRGAAAEAELDGVVYGDPATGKIEFTAVAGHGKGQGRLFRGTYRVLDDGRIERVYTVHYRTAADMPGEELGGTSRRYREVYTIDGDRLDATLEWWRDGAWQPFAVGKYSLVRREP